MRYAKWLFFLLFVWALAMPARVCASFVQITINGDLTGQSTYTYAFAKAGTNQLTDSDADSTGADIASHAGPLSTATKFADSDSTISTSGTATTLRVQTTAEGNRTRAEGYAQKGMTYISASEVPFTLTIHSLIVSGVFPDESPFVGEGDSVVEIHLNNLLSNQIDPIVPDSDNASTHGFGPHQSHADFFFLRLSTPFDESTLSVVNTLGPNTQRLAGSNNLLTIQDFSFSPPFSNGNNFGSWILNGPRTFNLGITQPAGTQPLSAVVLASSPLIPEPSTVVLVGVGLLPLARLMLKRRRR